MDLQKQRTENNYRIYSLNIDITKPEPEFSACFGSPFLPLPPMVYAQMLGEKIREHNSDVWLVNTGWTGGPYGIGKRISLAHTRAMIKAALNGKLDRAEMETHPLFNFSMPLTCPEVPVEILNPRNTWEDKNQYDQKAHRLAREFNANFEKYRKGTDDEIAEAGPKI